MRSPLKPDKMSSWLSGERKEKVQIKNIEKVQALECKSKRRLCEIESERERKWRDTSSTTDPHHRLNTKIGNIYIVLIINTFVSRK